MFLALHFASNVYLDCPRHWHRTRMWFRSTVQPARNIARDAASNARARAVRFL